MAKKKLEVESEKLEDVAQITHFADPVEESAKAEEVEVIILWMGTQDWPCKVTEIERIQHLWDSGFRLHDSKGNVSEEVPPMVKVAE